MSTNTRREEAIFGPQIQGKRGNSEVKPSGTVTIIIPGRFIISPC